MEAFIVRPFGVKMKINFDEVEKKLIMPALKKAEIKGYTTGEVIKAGNIREDMFQLLLTRDLVIADISIHNPNVFYELGIRHALRRKNTILINCGAEEVPFDLKTDRYFRYDQKKPGAGIDGLAEVIKATIDSESVTDSPVFMMLPAMIPQDPEKFLAVPRDFADELERAKGQINGKLGLLSFEASHFPWAIPALRIIGEKQYQAQLYLDARETWEYIQRSVEGDIEAYDRLATIYQRLAAAEQSSNLSLADDLFAQSEQAIKFLFDNENYLTPELLSEAHALKARNHKALWKRQWEGLPAAERSKAAIRSGLLKSSFESYRIGYEENFNRYFAGINTLALLKTIISLAQKEADEWKANFDNEELAESQLKQYEELFVDMGVMLKNTLRVSRDKMEKKAAIDVWQYFTEAELALLTTDNTKRISNLYFKALEIASMEKQSFAVESSRTQLQLFDSLGILEENVKAALLEYTKFNVDLEDTRHIIMFSGHMIDDPKRKKARFPAEKEEKVKEKINKEIKNVIKKLSNGLNGESQRTKIIGIAGGACGGDILFHECCREQNIDTILLLALPKEEFIKRSVIRGGNQWVDRFNRLYESIKNQVFYLSNQEELPSWLRSEKWKYSFWERNNLWILHTALTAGGRNITFIALWDGKKGDGPGGTENMINLVKKRGAKSIIVKP